MHAIGRALYAFVDKYLYWLNVPHVGVVDVIEIIIIAVVLYYLLVWIKNTRAWALFKGILFVLVFLLFAAVFQMSTILWLAGKLLNFAVIVLIVIFQPELRKGLEHLGKNRLIELVFNPNRRTFGMYSEQTVEALVRACYDMSRVKTGALIVMERSIRLDEYVHTGIAIDAEISSQLILNIFEKNTPLHDGALLLRENRIVAATCYLPLSDNQSISKELGTRHRAALGISEVSDSLTLIVSEETGAVSLAVEGRIYRDIDEVTLKNRLLKEVRMIEEDTGKKRKRKREGQAEDEEHTA